MFEDWLLATGFPSTTAFAPRQAALLCSNVGVEGSRIYYSLMNEANEQYATVRWTGWRGSLEVRRASFSTVPSSLGTYSASVPVQCPFSFPLHWLIGSRRDVAGVPESARNLDQVVQNRPTIRR